MTTIDDLMTTYGIRLLYVPDTGNVIFADAWEQPDTFWQRLDDYKQAVMEWYERRATQRT